METIPSNKKENNLTSLEFAFLKIQDLNFELNGTTCISGFDEDFHLNNCKEDCTECYERYYKKREDESNGC